MDRSDPEHAFDHEIGFQVGKKQLGDIIDRCIQKYGFTISAEVLDNIKALGFKYSTKGAITISIADMTVPDAKKTLIEATENKVLDIEKQYRRGFITNDERYRLVVDEWEQTTKDVTGALQDCLDEYNPIYMMANSGARGSMNQIRQLAGMRGLMANTAGKTIEIPIKANFREGLSVLEYFISSRGARKGLADTALRTADSGYLTRRLVDVSQDVIIREDDCGTTEGVWATAIYEKGQEVAVALRSASTAASPPCRSPTRRRARSSSAPTTCSCPRTPTCLQCPRHREGPHPQRPGLQGQERRLRQVLRHQPGRRPAGQPGRGRRRHRGAVHRRARHAAHDAYLPHRRHRRRRHHPGPAPCRGAVRGPQAQEDGRPRARSPAPSPSRRPARTPSSPSRSPTRPTATPASTPCPIPRASSSRRATHVDKGQELTAGALNPHDVLRIRGIDDDEFGRPGVRNYLVQEVQKVYRQQGVDINDKHIEVIVRQMMRKVRIEDAGDTKLLSGATVDISELRTANEEIAARTPGRRARRERRAAA